MTTSPEPRAITIGRGERLSLSSNAWSAPAMSTGCARAFALTWTAPTIRPNASAARSSSVGWITTPPSSVAGVVPRTKTPTWPIQSSRSRSRSSPVLVAQLAPARRSRRARPRSRRSCARSDLADVGGAECGPRVARQLLEQRRAPGVEQRAARAAHLDLDRQAIAVGGERVRDRRQVVERHERRELVRRARPPPGRVAAPSSISAPVCRPRSGRAGPPRARRRRRRTRRPRRATRSSDASTVRL